jgi:hypothetical protein
VEGRNASPRRQRFTIAHEIAHTFFYRFLPDGRPKKVNGALNHDQEEALCHLAAGRILVPRELIRNTLLARLHNPDPRMIVTASGMFEVSSEVAARRLKEECGAFEGLGLCEWVAEDIYLRTRQLHFSTNNQVRPLVLTWMIAPDPRSPIAPPRSSRLPADSPIWELCSGKRKSVEQAEMWLGSKLRARLGNAVVFKMHRKPVRVLATILELKKTTGSPLPN